MDVLIEYDPECGWFTAVIDKYGIITEGKDWNDLMLNLREAIQCTVE